MNRFFRALIEIPCAFLKIGKLVLVHGKNVNIKGINAISPNTEITLSRNGKLNITGKFHARSGSHICIRENGELIIGNNVFINHNCMIFCREKIVVGDNVQFSPNVMIYDHDHDFRVPGGLNEKKYKSSPIIIGNNVWIGANTVILRGTKIGDNVVIGAGGIINGEIPDGSIFVQKRINVLKKI